MLERKFSINGVFGHPEFYRGYCIDPFGGGSAWSFKLSPGIGLPHPDRIHGIVNAVAIFSRPSDKTQSRRPCSRLLAGCCLNHFSQTIDVFHHQRTAFLIDDADARKAI